MDARQISGSVRHRFISDDGGASWTWFDSSDFPITPICAEMSIIEQTYTILTPISFIGMMMVFFSLVKKKKVDDEEGSELSDEEVTSARMRR